LLRIAEEMCALPLVFESIGHQELCRINQAVLILCSGARTSASTVRVRKVRSA
jgi:hypothetical protein